MKETTYVVVPPIDGQTLPTEFSVACQMAEQKSKLIKKPIHVYQCVVVIDATTEEVKYIKQGYDGRASR